MTPEVTLKDWAWVWLDHVTGMYMVDCPCNDWKPILAWTQHQAVEIANRHNEFHGRSGH